jgi:hypothetical protein
MAKARREAENAEKTAASVKAKAQAAAKAKADAGQPAGN